VRLINGKWECSLCGSPVDVPPGAAISTMLAHEMGEPTVRLIMLDGVEAHRCDWSGDE
jgi:hypothetical protein